MANPRWIAAVRSYGRISSFLGFISSFWVEMKDSTFQRTSDISYYAAGTVRSKPEFSILSQGRGQSLK